MKVTHYLSGDLGGESGRVTLGSMQDGILTLKEIHRFPHEVVKRGEALHWDIDLIIRELIHGLQKAGCLGLSISAISTDTWGVDYVLLDADWKLLSPPRSYRDARTHEIFRRLQNNPETKRLLYAETGIQALWFNTVYQLMAEKEQNPELLKRTGKFLTMADYVNFLFSGRPVIEQSMASTTQLYNPRQHGWSDLLMETLQLPREIFPEIQPAGTVIGPLQGSLLTAPGFKGTQISATCSHDTGAAVAGVPAEGENWAYLSSGTWSLLGAELIDPIITEESVRLNFTNEVGFGGSIRFLKNIAGLWVLQECRRAWMEAGLSYTYPELVAMAVAVKEEVPLIEVNWSEFSEPGQMPAKIDRYCEMTKQGKPPTVGHCVRTILESLALSYARTLQELESLLGRRMDRLHIVGGGSQNEFLNQLTANAVGRPVIAGPAEATAIGNLLLQALSLGHLSSLADLRRVVRHSFPTRTYQPEAGTGWDQKFTRFQSIHLKDKI